MFKKILLLLIFALPLTAQLQNDKKENFNKAVEMFRYGQYEQAYSIFNSLAEDKSFVFRIPAEIFRGKILLKQGDYYGSQKIFSDLEQVTEDTAYKKEILLNLSVILYGSEKYYEAAQKLLEIISLSGTGEYYKYAKNSLDTLAENNLAPVQIDALLNECSEELKPLLTLLLGKSYLAQGNEPKAKESFLKIIQQFSSSPLRPEAEDYFYERKSINLSLQTDPVIAVVLPRAGSTSINEIREGIKYAVHEFNTRREDRIGLVFIDFDKDELSKLKSRLLNYDVKCIMGPVYSDDVRNIITEFRGIKIPIISPTATDNDLTSLNEYFFQANPNFTTRAKAVAQYIYYVENKRRMGVLNAIEGYSPLLSSVFTTEFRKLGGEIVINQTFKSRSGEFEDQVARISEVIANIEGLYIPIADKEDLTPLLTAFARNNLSVPIYGNQDWFLGKGYGAFPGLSGNLIFESDYFIDYNSYSYDMFNNEFANVTNMGAERNVLYGYDITRYFLNQLARVNAGPDVIAARMINGNIVTGYHNNICFDEERVNKFVNIVRYRDGIFELVDKFKTSK